MLSFQHFRDELVWHQSDQDRQAEKLEEYLQWMRALPNQDVHALVTTLRKDLKLDFYHLAYDGNPSFTQLVQKGIVKNNAQHALAVFYLRNVPSDRQSPEVAGKLKSALKKWDEAYRTKNEKKHTPDLKKQMDDMRDFICIGYDSLISIKKHKPEGAALLVQMKKAAGRAYNQADMRGLKEGYKDLIQLIREIPAAGKEVVDNALIRNLVRDLPTIFTPPIKENKEWQRA